MAKEVPQREAVGGRCWRDASSGEARRVARDVRSLPSVVYHTKGSAAVRERPRPHVGAGARRRRGCGSEAKAAVVVDELARCLQRGGTSRGVIELEGKAITPLVTLALTADTSW